MNHATHHRTHRLAVAGTGLAVGGLTLFGLVAPSQAAPTAPPTSSAKGTAALEQLKADGASAIADRQAQLTKVAGRLSAAPGCDVNGTIANVIASDGPALTALGAKLAADTTVADARADHQAIFDQFRIYLVVTPQALVTSACGHIHTAVTTLDGDAAKLTTRVDAAAAGGADMTAARQSLTDLHAKLASATTQADTASTSLAAIAPDKGDKAIAASNAAAVDAARKDLVAAKADLTTATKDARAVVKDLKDAAGRH